jgi:hypothetical protein
VRAGPIIVAALLLAAPASAQIVIYDSNPRIIRVPETNIRNVAPIAHTMKDDEIIDRIERHKAQLRRPVAKPAPEAPRPRAELPPLTRESTGALLSAPPPAIGPGSLTPIYPTPRWRNADAPPITAENTE